VQNARGGGWQAQLGDVSLKHQPAPKRKRQQARQAWRRAGESGKQAAK